jgi:hypothetical protein
MPTVRTRRTLAALAAFVLSLPVATGVAGALPAEPPPDWETAEVIELPAEPDAVLLPSNAFPRIPGVDLYELGYEGEPLDADALDRIRAVLPEAPDQRIWELSIRLDVGAHQLDGLVLAERLLQRAVERLASDVDELEVALAVAQRYEAEARERVAEAGSRLESRSAELASHRADMAEAAVAAYVSPPDADVLAQVLGGAATTTSDLSAKVLFSAKADHDDLVRDRLEVSIALARERLAHADAVVEDAAQRTTAIAAGLATVEQRTAVHESALAVVEAARADIAARLPVLQADMDRTVAEELRKAEEEARRIEEELRRMEEELRELDTLARLEPSALARIPTTSVSGIRIHPALAPRLQALLEHAHADGIPLGGWGYRTTQSQIELRRKHCGPTPEDIYLKAPSECSPPTAKPGRSMHERGLAVDFHLAGRSISTRSSPGYQWLAEHAAAYGFYNLPSEPWHWSVNAQ